jgi:hypothetical protein
VQIIHKVNKTKKASISELVSALNPFGFPSSFRGNSFQNSDDDLRIYSSEGIGYVQKNNLNLGKDLAMTYKVMISKTISEHAGEPSKDGKFKVLSTVRMLVPGEICTFSYIILGPCSNENEALNLKDYICTKFVRFLLLQAISSINISKEKFIFVPMQDFTEPWTDEKLYKKYGLTPDEIAFIESMIRPMDASAEQDDE